MTETNFHQLSIYDSRYNINYRFFLQPGDVSFSLAQEDSEQVKNGAYVETIESGRRILQLSLVGTVECDFGTSTTYAGLSRRVYDTLKNVAALDRQRIRYGTPGSVTLNINGISINQGYLKRVEPSDSIFYKYDQSDPADLTEFFDKVIVTVSSRYLEYL